MAESETVKESRVQRALAAVELEFSDLFRECVVYTPPHRQAICIEPYSCLPGAFHLVDRQVDTGIRILEPGETKSATMTIYCRSQPGE